MPKKLKLKYRALVMDSRQKPVADELVYRHIAGISDDSAALSTHFERPIPGVKISDVGVSFEYDEPSRVLLAVAAFDADIEPSEDQLKELVARTTPLMDRGYYGEDGWFLDIGNRGYYVLLVDPEHPAAQPVSVICT